MFTRIYILIIIFITLNTYNVFAQYYDPEKAKQVAEQPKKEQPKPPMEENNVWDKFYFGGNIGLQFGTITAIQISPLVGYKITERFSLGGIFTYIYAKQRFIPGYSVYGLAPFARFMITEDFFATGEVSFLNTAQFRSGYEERIWTTLPMLGGGYLVRFGNRGGMMVTVLYNFNNRNPNSIYGPFVIRTGFFF